MSTTVRPPESYTPATSPRVLRASDAELQALRAFRDASGYTFAALFRRNSPQAEGTNVPPDDRVDDACGVLRALFAMGYAVRTTVVRERLGEEAMALLDRLEMLRPHDERPEETLGTVLVCPMAGLLLLCDHPYAGAGRRMAPDVVYSPLTVNTQQFMVSLTRTPCDEMLELCSGSGVAALASARLARTAVAVDITARSTEFAAANARLNGIANVESLEGDLYAPVAGRTFDRIVAHPPYMPEFEQGYIFRDGGADGEQVTRRIIAGLPDHLRPGGRFFCICLATDRADAPLEQRIRGWLGARADEFDVMLVELRPPRDPTEFYAHRAYDQGGGFAEVEPRHRFFKELGITSLVYGAMLLQRRTRERPVFTVRRKKGDLTASRQLDWAMAWETMGLDQAFPSRFLDVVPRPADDLRMQLTYVPHEGKFALAGCMLRIDAPLAFEVDCPPWVPQMLERALQPRTVREHLAGLQRDGIVPADVSAEAFASAVRDLATTGVLLLPGVEPPPAVAEFGEVLDRWPVVEPTALERAAAQFG